MKNIFWLFVGLIIFSCKNESADVTKALKEMQTAKIEDPKNLKLPDACSMIEGPVLMEILNRKDVPVNINAANDPGNPNSKACFFKWDDNDTPNAGILIQLQTNPVFSEYDEYISKFVTSKLTEGETQLGSDKRSIFKKFNAGSIEGAYSFEQSKFYWNYGNNYLVMLAMNITTLNESQMVNVAEKIANEINKNFVAKVD